MLEQKEDGTQTESSDKTNVRMQMLSRSRRNSQLEHEIFLAMIPDWKFDLNGYYDQLTTSLYKWDEFFELCKYKIFSFEDYIHNEYFYDIYSIHNKLIDDGNLKGILPVVYDLMQRKLHFLIVYVFLTNEVPKEFKNLNFLFFGLTNKYPELIAKARKNIESTHLPIVPVKQIFKIKDIDVDPLLDLI
ncbi:hypothetical protein BpHYR1_048681 [Brachionus plicatilis]|uniref:Uncharacterized protein n=1 Tax=Brachionus plicatilis TaxID=10195 RepID=A0A3M7S4M9_BRAPC|nr:hypothetical protein BpHYR1_048681 [Brachionus plicatilis]